MGMSLKSLYFTEIGGRQDLTIEEGLEIAGQMARNVKTRKKIEAKTSYLDRDAVMVPHAKMSGQTKGGAPIVHGKILPRPNPDRNADSYFNYLGLNDD